MVRTARFPPAYAGAAAGLALAPGFVLEPFRVLTETVFLWLVVGLAIAAATWLRGGYRLLTTDQLWAMVSQDAAGVLLVDTRQDWEYAAGHMQGAMNFPMEPTWLSRLTRRGELEQFLGPDKGKHIVFY